MPFSLKVPAPLPGAVSYRTRAPSSVPLKDALVLYVLHYTQTGGICQSEPLSCNGEVKRIYTKVLIGNEVYL